jgi:aminopeptidase C
LLCSYGALQKLQRSGALQSSRAPKLQKLAPEKLRRALQKLRRALTPEKQC